MASTAVRYPTPQRVDGSTQHTSVEVTDPLLWRTRKMVNVAVDSSIASRLTYMDFSDETRQRFTDVAEAMLSVNAGTARAATGAL